MPDTTPVMTAASAMQQLVEWSAAAPLPLWQRDALRRLYSACPLSAQDEEDVFLILKSQHSLLDDHEAAQTPTPIAAEHVPAGTAVSSSVTMCCVSDVTHVNALADNQKVHFGGQGLTVVFGNNGSGKSGYARILKTVCRARSSEDILHNVYDKKPTVPASAKLLFAIGGTQQPVFDWKAGVPAAVALSRISVFDSKCAAIHVDEKNEAAFTPLPLQVIKELSDLCRRFKPRLQTLTTASASQLPLALRDLKCSRETAAGRYLHRLASTSPYEDATRLAELSATELARMGELKLQLQADPQKAISSEESRRTKIASLIQRLESIAGALSTTAIDSYRDLLTTANTKVEAARIAATQAFTDEPLDGVGSQTWKALWEAARQYSDESAYPSAAFPNTDDARCVLCQQPLLSEGAVRFSRFEAFVRDNSQKSAADANAAVSRARTSIDGAVIAKDQVDEDVRFVKDDIGDAATSSMLQAFYDSSSNCRDDLLKAAVGAVWTPPRALSESPVTALKDASENVTTRIAELRKAENPEARKKLQSELQELEDRAFLKTVLDDVQTEIDRQKKLARIQVAISETDTNKITRKSTELADSLITAAWRDQFAAEVSRMDIHHLRIELQREGGAYGAAKFRVALIRDSSVKLGTVLSEGEYRCIALAAFFAELATSDDKSALVFDDPVSSLDHEHREAVAKRLAEEAATGRQVVVFTHDVFFLDLISRHAKTNNAAERFLTVNRLPDGSRCGAVDDGVPPNVAPAEDLAEGIRRQVKQFEGLHKSGRLVQWNAQTNSFSIQLRKCWERAVAEILSPVVERFNVGVNTKNIWQIAALEESDCIDMRAAYKRCSELNHEKCAELGRSDPTPTDYYNEVAAVKTWIQGIRTKQAAAQSNHPTV